MSNLTILYRSFTTYSNPLKGFHQRAFFFEVQKYNVCPFLSGPDKARDVVRLRIVSYLVAYDRSCPVNISHCLLLSPFMSETSGTVGTPSFNFIFISRLYNINFAFYQ